MKEDKEAMFAKGEKISDKKLKEYFKNNPGAYEKWEKNNEKYREKFKKNKEASLKERIIKAAHENPDLRAPLRPLLRKIASSEFK